MFEIPDLYSVGSFLIPLKLLLFVALGLILLPLVRWLCQHISFPYAEWFSILTNAVITYILIWKFSFILTNVSRVVEQPALILFANGGSLGHFLAFVGALFVAFYSLKKRQLAPYPFLDLLSIWAIATFTIFGVLQRTYGLPTNMPWGISLKEAPSTPLVDLSELATATYHPIFLYQFLLGAFLLLYLFQMKDKLGSGVVTIHSLFLYGSGLLLISAFVYQPAALFLGLSGIQWLYAAMSLVGLIGSLFYKPKLINNDVAQNAPD